VTRGRAAAARALLGAVLALLAGQPAAWAAPAHRQRPQQEEQFPLDVSLLAISPVVTRKPPTDHMSISLTLRNRGAERLHRLRIRLVVGPVMGSRSELERVAAEPSRTGSASDDLELPDTVELAPGAATRVRRFDFPLDALPTLGAGPSVRPLRVLALGRTLGGSTRIVGVAETFLVWAPERVAATPVSLLVPITRGAPAPVDPIEADADLARDVAAGGRLSRLLSGAVAAGDVRPTYALDPELVESLSRLAGRAADARGTAAAQAFLAALRDAVDGADVIALPYADPDVAAQVHAGLSAEIGAAGTLGRQILGDVLGVESPAALAWPVNSEADTETLGELTDRGARGVLLRRSALPPLAEPDYTPSAAYPLRLGAGRRVTALIADDVMSDLLEAGGSAPRPAVAVQRILAELALVTLERPSTPRAMVLVPPRVWSTSGSFLAKLLVRLGQVPYAVTRDLSSAIDAEPSQVERPGTTTYGLDAQSDELPSGFLAAVGTQRGRLRQFASILTERSPAADAANSALLRAQSAGWRDDSASAEDLLRAVARSLDAEWRKLAITSNGQTITLTSRSGSVPITLDNRLGQPVKVRLRAESLRLVALPDVDLGRALSPGRQTVAVRAKALSAGVFPVQLSLVGPDGGALPVTAQVTVRSTAYGTVALLVTGGAFGVLCLAAGMRLVRRRRRAATADEV
jgi:hypothetical protein